MMAITLLGECEKYFAGLKKMIRLENVTPENWRLGLKVSDAQKEYVSDSANILARAWAYRDENSEAFVIYDDEAPIGMVMYYDIEEMGAYDFSQFFIDEKYQGKGYGLAAAKLVLEHMKKAGRFDKVVLCYIDGNDAAKNLYEKLGFHLTGDSDEDEIIMEMSF